MQAVIAWLILLAVFLIIEAATAGLATIWFAGGALIAGIAAYFQASLMLQLALFFVVSVALLIFTRPVAMRLLNNKEKTKTNIDSIPGKKAIVTEDIDNLIGSGKVRIHDIDWRAQSTDDTRKIAKDTIVIVKEVQGVTLLVEKEDTK